MIKYKTVNEKADTEIVIEKSKFIAHISPVLSLEEARFFYSDIRSRYKDATHNVPVFVIGENQDYQWMSDDGEPSGTAAAPMLAHILGQGITNVALVVTRYFGGVKLGTGGLVRAYGACAADVIKKSGIKEVRDEKKLEIKIPYSLNSLLQNKSFELKYKLLDTRYEDEVVLTIEYESENEQNIFDFLKEISNGKLKKYLDKV